MPKAQKILATQHDTEHLDIGISGYKIDECDGYDRWLWPDHAKFPSGKSGTEIRQTYGLQLQNLTTNIFRKHNKRTYGLVRGTHAGGQSLPYVLYSDYYTHRDYITALCNSGISGLLWCPEVRSASSPADWIRRVQTACFSPLMQLNAWASGTKPWSFPEVEGAVRNAIQWRLRLTPYLYSAFARYHTDGTPPFRPMALETQIAYSKMSNQGNLDDTDNPYALPEIAEIKDQYIMGDSLMVTPLFADETQREVKFPPGNWYNFYTGQYAGNDELISIEANLDTIPLYVKDGGIIPLLPQGAELHENPTTHTLEIRHYGQTDGHFLLYNDDGKTYDYETGDYTWQELRVTGSKNKLQGNTFHHKGNNTWYCNNLIWKFMTP